ncbi:hypothetical protein [Caulobacter sp. RL271]|uniref:Uncharacterized protein n=1 Tax=Caulobacter segnis TaxID=88688 RepID=A0ABY4ZZ02_9CAUL|nr:hypothetical protein [Caulobacter segnis]USQ97227.1 hypothetical protein MZV50_06710 [Caulobacter segnis]
MDDKHRLHAAAVALIVSTLWAGFKMVAFIFGEPPPGRRKVIQQALEAVLTIASVTAAAPLCAPWAADAVNWALSLVNLISPVKVGFKVDHLTAVALLASLTVLLIANPDARARLFAWIKGKVAPGVVQ